MTSTQEQIEISYDVSNEFFKLWLDERMHYTCGVWDAEHDTLEKAQENKSRILYDLAEMSPEKTILDIGCGWGANLEYIAKRGCKAAHGITLSSAQVEECNARKIPKVLAQLCDYKDFVPKEPYDALVSIEMVDHVVSPAQANAGQAVDLYRKYFNKMASFTKPGGLFAFQSILRNRVPRNRKDLEDLKFTADIIFPGGLNARIEELIVALSPSWELLELYMRREDYGKTTAEWLRRLRAHEKTIRERWGDQVFVDYDRYLDTCVRAFDAHWSGDVQMKLRRIQ
ncbi:MAG: class I SAM-dependent methyltransferase [Polyangiaceae bacterium]